MKNKKYIKLFTSLLVVIAISFSFGISSYSLDKQSYSPGDKAKLTLTIELTYGVDSGETFLAFRNLVLDVNSFSTPKTYYIGRSDSSSTTITVPIEIPLDVGSSIYAIPVRISGTALIDSGGKTKTEVVSSQAIVSLKVVKKPKVNIKFLEDVLREGEKSNIEICNYGGMAKDIEISLEGDYFLKDGKLFLNELKGCVNKSIIIETTLEGKQSIPFLIKYKDYIGDEGESKLYIPISINKGKTVFIITHENNIYSGRNSNIKLKINNLGNDAKEVRIKPKRNLNFVGKSEIVIDEILKGKYKVLDEIVYTDLSPGIRIVDFEISWKENGKDKQEIIQVPLNIISKDDIEVYLEAEPLPLKQGEENTISIVVANKAKYEISSVSVSMESEAFEILDLSNKKFIGSLQSDDFSSEQFKVKLKRAGNYDVNVSVYYKDTSGREIEKDFTIPIKVVKNEEENDYSIAIILLILLFIFGFWKRKELPKIRIKGLK